MKTPVSILYRSFYLIAEYALILLAFHLAHIFRGFSYSQTLNDQVIVLYSIISWYIIARITKIHTFNPITKLRIKRLISATFLFGLTITMIGFLFKDAKFSRLLMGYYVLGFGTFVFLLHLIGDVWYLHINNKDFRRIHLLIIGAGRVGTKVYNEILKYPELNYELIGFLDDNGKEKNFQDKIIGKIDELENILNINHVNEVIIALPLSSEKKIAKIIDLSEKYGIRLRLIPDIYRVTPQKVELVNIGNIPIIQFRKIPLDDPMNRVFKRLFDISFSIIVLILSFPVIIISAIAIKCTSKGPAIFVQERTGYNQNSFKLYKLRSMKKLTKNVEDTLQAVKNDPRKTSIGEFLRRTNIDELPQFLNVLKGEMSVVGPRPHMLVHTKEFTERMDNYLVRHFIKPGITGWAQVNGWRGPTDTRERLTRRVEFDLWYMENWSFWLDLKIILMTIFTKRSRLNAF